MVYYIQIGLFSLMILIVIYYNVRSDLNRDKMDRKLFEALILSTACVTVLDVLMYLVDMRSGSFFLSANQLVTCLYYIFNPIPCLIWCLYADILIFDSPSRLKKMFTVMIIPTIVLTLLSIMSISKGFFFYIDTFNKYHRGTYNWLLTLICCFYLFYTFLITLINRKNISSKDFFPMLFFLFPPIIGFMIQIRFQGVSTLWMSVTFSILVIYINIQKINVSTDYLTGLYNRRQLDSHLKRFSHFQSSAHKIAGMMIDLNDMKSINDSQGHMMGDIALEQTALILKKSFHKDDFIARYGGDEFVIIFMVKDYDGLSQTVSRVESNLEKFNKNTTFPFKLSFSIGYDLFDPKKQATIDDFIRYLDQKMYLSKEQYHKLHDMPKLR
ncbi:GGDEF domain-containing protein [Fusibacter ferrireducens]|uniref:GGDEF domain-containing protein n=1 Tax=Fusibacter ferrireducens TaxID=2785058 RepID=A0ABR9ZU96_9FIRM|nr:GGDEF domain-containing protein [Fusibacter ferrireducens]MBF4694010.1 GGDEF domain-containing protein [Fusibacter ferrireducens]